MHWLVERLQQTVGLYLRSNRGCSGDEFLPEQQFRESSMIRGRE